MLKGTQTKEKLTLGGGNDELSENDEDMRSFGFHVALVSRCRLVNKLFYKASIGLSFDLLQLRKYSSTKLRVLAYQLKAFMKQVIENSYLSFCNNEHRIVQPCKETGAELQDIDVALRVVGAAAVKLLTSLGGLAFDGKINNSSKVFFLNSQCFNGCPQEVTGSASFEDFLLRKLKVLQG
ncbi:hypothetical protein KIW84_034264 [Lathyrus oleraceus]|uniref:Uncharacterized protein n=1 Tax=Pisum sativum TaxID=3888 RepID=A0A9D4Y3J5_PEA|nr:hypothetical protein KIW84_051488 [Pisum sativum]KAI5429616.1 hypothetical protein KIW84_034263 [Pisum sativum]KAI5429617.1 hypothetical protein KIW84_034264 [Pisum sativum]